MVFKLAKKATVPNGPTGRLYGTFFFTISEIHTVCHKRYSAHGGSNLNDDVLAKTSGLCAVALMASGRNAD